MSIVPSFFWNSTTQRLLSQSNNLSYSTRGVFRVNDTQDSRKGDYWFRDFGMVMACSYMTEMAFRAVENFYISPLLTDTLKLNQLSKIQHPATKALLYPNAMDYEALPDMVRKKVMGSLIKNTSDLVPKLMREARQSRLDNKTPETAEEKILQSHLKAIIENPTQQKSVQDFEAFYQRHLNTHSLTPSIIRDIVRHENPAKREEALGAAVKNQLASRPNIKQDVVETGIRQAVKMAHARQMGILIDHLHRNLNFQEYARENFLNKNHPLSSTVSALLNDFSEKLSGLYQKEQDLTQAQSKFSKFIESLDKLPEDKRMDPFIQKMNGLRNGMFLKKGISLATNEEIKEFDALVISLKPLLKNNKQTELMQTVAQVDRFFGKLEQNQDQHLSQLWENLTPYLKSKIKKRFVEAIDSVVKLNPHTGNSRHALLDKAVKSLNLGSHFDEAHQALIKNLRATIPNDPSQSLSPVLRKDIQKYIDQFFSHPGFSQRNELLKPLLKEIPTAAEFKRMIVDGMHSKAVVSMINTTQKNGTWPKTFATVLLNLLFYGWAASNFDNKILQPFQKKLVAERGTSQEIATAGYLGLIPGLLVLSQMFDRTTFLSAIKKLGHFGRFTVVGGIALATFAASTFGFLQVLLKRPAPIAPALKPPFKPVASSAGLSANNLPRPAFSNYPAASGFSAALPTPFLQPYSQPSSQAPYGYQQQR